MLKNFLVMSEYVASENSYYMRQKTKSLLIIPYTHLYGQNNSDDVRFRFVRKLSFHDHSVQTLI